MANSTLQPLNDDDTVDLNRLTGISREEESAIDRRYQNQANRVSPIKPADRPGEPASTESIAAAESGAGASFSPSRGFYRPGVATSKAKKVTGVSGFLWGTKARRRTSIAGSIIGMFGLVFSLFGFSAVATHEIQGIVSALLGKQDGIVQIMDKTVARHYLRKNICQALGGCKDETDTPSPTQQTAAAAKQAGEGLAEDLDKFNFTDPDVVTALANQGIKVEITDGKMTGLFDQTTNKPITGDDLTDDAAGELLFNRFEVAVPEWFANQVTTYPEAMAEDSLVTQDGFPEGEPTDSPQADMESQIEQGTAGEPSVTDEGTPSGDQTVADPSSGELKDALSAAIDASNNGASESAAVAAGVAKFKVGNYFLIAGLLAASCTIKNTVTSAAFARVPELIGLLIRHGNLLLTLASQLATGNISGNQVNTLMNDLSPDPNAPAGSEAALPFSQTAAWFRDNNLPVTNTTNPQAPDYTPDISNSSLPSANGATAIVEEIDSIIDSIPGEQALSGFVCPALTSWFGGIVQGVFGLGQLAIEGASCALSIEAACAVGIGEQVVVTTEIATAEYLLTNKVLPEVLTYFLPIGINGHEDATQWVSNSDAGLALSYGDEGRQMGAQPVTEARASTLDGDASGATTTYNDQQPWLYRTFALSNPASLTSKLLFEIPTSFTATMNNISSYFSSLPETILHDFSSIFLHNAIAATVPVKSSEPWLAYNTVVNALSDSQLNADDFDSNEQHFFTTVSYDERSVQRITVLGNPDVDGVPIAPGSDSNNDDLLHCFTDPYTEIIEVPNNAASAMCGKWINVTSGGFSYPQYFGIGQLTDDNPNYSSDPTQVNPNPNYTTNSVPNDQDIADMYCTYLQNNVPPPSPKAPPFNLGACEAYMASQVVNEMANYEQYVFDAHVGYQYLAADGSQS